MEKQKSLSELEYINLEGTTKRTGKRGPPAHPLTIPTLGGPMSDQQLVLADRSASLRLLALIRTLELPGYLCQGVM